MTYLDDPTPLCSFHEWLYFCPCTHYNWDQNVNAVLLLLLYVGIFLSIYYRNGLYLVLMIPILLLVAIGNRLMYPSSSTQAGSPTYVSSKSSDDTKPRKESYQPSNRRRTNPSKVGVDFQVDDAFKRTRTYIPRANISDADPTAFAKTLYSHTFRPDAVKQM